MSGTQFEEWIEKTEDDYRAAMALAGTRTIMLVVVPMLGRCG